MCVVKPNVRRQACFVASSQMCGVKPDVRGQARCAGSSQMSYFLVVIVLLGAFSKYYIYNVYRNIKQRHNYRRNDIIVMYVQIGEQ